MHTIRKTLTFLALAGLVAACGEATDGRDLGDDPAVIFDASTKADGFALDADSPEADGILRVANSLDFATLDDVVGLDKRAARNIVETREANGDFADVYALDDVSYVGQRAFAKMLDYAKAQGWVEGAVSYALGTPEGDALVLRVANTVDFETLDDAVGLDKRAARNIVDTRAANGDFADVDALDAVSYVGDRALNKMLDWAIAQGWAPADEGEGEGDELDTPLVHGIHEGSYEALGILAVANSADLETLDVTIDLDKRAAKNIFYGRQANGDYASLEELDAVSYVGAAAFARLLDFARAQDLLPYCGDGLVQDAEETCDGTVGCSEACELTYTCGDGVAEVGEDCDDGNLADADGCSAACRWEVNRHDQGLGYENAKDVDTHTFYGGHFAARSGRQYWRVEIDRPSRIHVDIMGNNLNRPLTYAELIEGHVSQNAPNQAGGWSVGEHGVENPWRRSIAFWAWYWDRNCGWNGCRRPDYDSVQRYKRLRTHASAGNEGFDGTFEVEPGVYYIGFTTGAGNQNYTPALSYIFELDIEPLVDFVCGDGVIEGDEACDDGARVDGDGCSRRCALETTQESESNDGIDRANHLDAFQRVSGQLGAGDEDWFSVALEDGDDLTVQLAGCGFDGYFELYDADGTLVAEDDDSAGDYCPLLELNDLDGGYYYLKLRHANAQIAGGAYTLELLR